MDKVDTSLTKYRTRDPRMSRKFVRPRSVVGMGMKV